MGIVVEKSLVEIEAEAFDALEKTDRPDEVAGLVTEYLGRKGVLTTFLRNISNLDAKERPVAGKNANLLKIKLDKAFKTRLERLEAENRDGDAGLDVTLPGRPVVRGALHPITRVSKEISDIFVKIGFDIAEGPEVETDYYNFEALNIPKYHPARDMQDTFYISEGIVLRTHTSPTQPRVMEKGKPPVRIIAPGKVYRCDSDLTHTPMFHQVEGLMVDENVSFGDLKGVLTTFAHEMFDTETSLRFRPSFFPFTEPSAEVDIQCVICGGKGCRTCSNTGWLEILGSGMVDPAVYGFVGYDPEIYSGFAFGMGIERIAMLKYGIDDIQLFFKNDIRFLSQF
jgi:phenylalanyl-tRNA synthetase alpha chain